MNEIIKPFQVLFGTMWEELLNVTDTIGAFAIWHDSKEFYIDDNALRLLGASRAAMDYTFLNAMTRAADTENDAAAPVKLVLLDSRDENVTAGVIIKKDHKDTAESSGLLGLIPQNALADRIAEAGDNSFLMLIQLEHIDSDRDERSFINSAVEAMKAACPEGSAFSYHARLQYWVFVPDCGGKSRELAEKLQQAVKNCDITDEFGVHISETHSMTFTGGYVMFDSRQSTAVKQLHYASFALYEAASEETGTIKSFSEEQYDIQKNDYRRVQNFFYLVEQNSFRYHFQPIVSAEDGSIVAYEALMRTDKEIGLNPLQILDYAQKYDRLYDIEHSTMFNVLHHLSQNQSFFKKRKLFINAIPSSFLTEDDWSMLLEDYGELMEKVVIELTEQTDTSDENLSYLINRLRRHKVQMAIDDYGTGYSNTSRLIRYTPDYIKLDHSLISHIDTNVRLQSIVSGLVEMMHSNGFAVLAEGVETSEELHTLSGMHVDLYQGFYISRPKPIFIHEISEEIQSEIIRYNLESQEDQEKVYYADSDSTISINELIREKYTSIYIEGGSHLLEGEYDMPAVMIPINVKEDSKAKLTLKNVKLEAVPDPPAIALGSGSSLTIEAIGDNRLVKGGIMVPSKASLELVGGGKLTILPEAVSCYAIGNEYDLTYGRIKSSMTGELCITVCGDNCIGIGGGRTDNEGGIEITGGMIEISCSGAVSLAIGSMQENADVKIYECGLSITAASANFAGIGSFEGSANIAVQDAKIDVISGGNNMCAIGSLHGGTADISVKRCELSCNIRGRNIINIGTNSSTAMCDISNSVISLYAEGSNASGIGDSEGGGRVRIFETEVHITFLTSNGYAMGCRDGELIFEGGSEQISINE